VLDQVRRHVAVDDFGVESPSLSEMFLDAAGSDAGEDQTVDMADADDEIPVAERAGSER
jgi:hypothetical protein